MKTLFRSLFALLVVLVIAVPLSARDMSDANILIPIAGRAHGDYGTQWRTDLVITNLEADPVNLFVTFHSGATSGAFTERIVPGYGTLVVEDVLARMFTIDSGLGMLRVSSATPGARFTARAYLYNIGNSAGHFGQGIGGVPVDALGQEHVLSGITGTAGRRTNVGIANPWTSDADVILMLQDASGETIGSYALTVTRETVVQINDVFTAMGMIPLADASIRVNASLPVYPYASIVRADTGDPVFVAGSGMGRAAGVITPLCSAPAPMIHPYRGEEPTEETIVQFTRTTNRVYADQLAVQLGFTIDAYYPSRSISAVLTQAQIAALRCDTAVKVIRRDGAIPEAE